MAIVFVNNATVESTFWDGKGAKISESFNKNDGSTGKQYYSLFFDEPHGLSQGDSGNFSGLLSVKARKYTPDGSDEERLTADIVLNSPRFTESDDSY